MRLSRQTDTDEQTATQIREFHDSAGGGFFATAALAKHTILRLKDGMDSSEPSTNGVSATNLFCLSALLDDENYEKLARETVNAFEAEIMQYPWLFGSFMPGIVAATTGVKTIVRIDGTHGVAPISIVGSGPSADVTLAADAPNAITEGVIAGEMAVEGGLLESAEAMGDLGKIKDGVAEQGGAVEELAKLHSKDVAMDVTQSGHVVEAGETPHPIQKMETTTAKPVTKPRGVLETTCYLDESHGLWLKQRNKLVAELKPRSDGKERVMICEGKTCREVDDVEG